MSPAPHQPESDRPRDPAGSQNQHLLVKQRARRLFALVPAHRDFERVHRSTIVRVVADPLAVLLEDHRVAASRPLDRPLLLLQERHDRFLVRDRDAAALQVQPEQLLEKRLQLACGTMNGTITLFKPRSRKAALWTTGLKLCSIGSPMTP